MRCMSANPGTIRGGPSAYRATIWGSQNGEGAAAGLAGSGGMTVLLGLWRRAAGREPGVVVGAERGEGDFPQPGEEPLFRLAERLLKGGVHRLFDEAAGGF